MAQLKDTTVAGSLRATDSIYTTTAQLQILRIPTTSGGTTFGPGTNGQVLKSNGTSVYWASDNDSHYTTHMYVNATSGGATNNAATTNTTTYLHLYDNTAKRETIQFKGSGTTSVTSTGGVITISSADSKTGTVTSVQVQATSPVTSSTSTAQSSTLNTTIALADAYGDTKNPYGSKTKNYVLAAPSGAAGVPSFRALVAADIPTNISITGNAATATSLANFQVSTTTSLGLEITTNSVGYVSGLTKDNWNYQQTDGALYGQFYSASWKHEIFGDYRTGQISVRGKNNGTWQNWRRVLDETNGATILGLGSWAYKSSGSASDVGLGNVSNAAQITKATFTAAYQVIYSTAASTPAVLSANTTTTKKFLRMTGTGSAGAAPAWDTVTKTDVGLGNVTNHAQVTSLQWDTTNKKLTYKISEGTANTLLTFAAGSNISLTADANKITIANTYSYTLPLAASGTRGGIQIGYSESGTNYAVKLSNEKAYVTVPWTDTKLTVAGVTSGTTYYPIVGTGTTAATRQYDTTGFIYKGTNGTTSAVGSAQLTLGNSTASGTANNKQGQLIIYGSTAYAHTISGAPTAARTLTLPDKTDTIAVLSDLSWSNITNKTTASTSVYGITKLTSSYTSNDSTLAATGASILAALQTLDVNAVGVAATTGNRFISQISETDGKISATLATATIGSASQPVWIDSGTIKSCNLSVTPFNAAHQLWGIRWSGTHGGSNYTGSNVQGTAHSALIMTDYGLFLGKWDSSNEYLGVIWNWQQNSSGLWEADTLSTTLPVNKGGTGTTTFTSGNALIGNGTGAITTRAITNMTAKNYITYNTNLMTTNTLAYWNGAYSSSNNSNLTYCTKGEFGSIITASKGTWTQYGLIYASTTTNLATLGVGTSGQFLKSNGSSAPSWASLPTASTSTAGIVTVGNGLSVSSGTISVSTTAGSSTLSWGTEVTLGTVGGLAIKAKLPANPNTDHYAWSDITGKPSTFPPSSHTHGNITNDGKLATANRVVWANADKEIAPANIVTNGSYLSNINYLTVNADNQSAYRVFINGSTRISSNLYLVAESTTSDVTMQAIAGGIKNNSTWETDTNNFTAYAGNWTRIYLYNRYKYINKSTNVTTWVEPHISFRLYSPSTNAGSITDYYENYHLPEVNTGRTTNASYNILTTKNTVTIGQGGTGLTASPSILVNLASTTAANVLQTSPRPGVTGTLGAGNGGTGKTNLQDAANALINALSTGSSNLTANDYVITQYAGGGTTNITYHRRPASAVINATLVKAALGTDSTTTTFLRKDGTWNSVTWGNISGRPSNAGSVTTPVYWSSNAATACNFSVSTFNSSNQLWALKYNGTQGTGSIISYTSSALIALKDGLTLYGWGDGINGSIWSWKKNSNGLWEADTLSATLPVNKGGTGATTAAAARTNLGALANTWTSASTTWSTAYNNATSDILVFVRWDVHAFSIFIPKHTLVTAKKYYDTGVFYGGTGIDGDVASARAYASQSACTVSVILNGAVQPSTDYSYTYYYR